MLILVSAALEFVLDMQIGLDIVKAVTLSSFNYYSWRSEVMRVRSTMQTNCVSSLGSRTPCLEGWGAAVNSCLKDVELHPGKALGFPGLL